MTEAELFAIRYRINQAVQIPRASYIIVITDSIHLAKCIFDSLTHSYQIQSIAIAQDLRVFFNKNTQNSINFWECPSNAKWSHHMSVDKESKKFNLTPILLCKTSWDYSKKEECNNIIRNWQMTFQASDLKGNNFLELLDNNYLPITPTYKKGGLWINQFGYSNSLCARATRVITNHDPIGEYHLRFFPRENFNCPCGSYPIESR